MTPDASTAATALLAVHSVDEFVFSVPDLEAARQFYASFGLDVRDEDGGLALYAFGHPQRWGRIRQAAGRKRLLWLSLGIHEGTRRASPNAWISRASRASPRPPARTMAASGSPVPTACRYSCAPRQVLAVGAGAADPATALRQCRPRPARSRAPRVQPLYLSHILLFSADVARATRFYVDVLGLRVSDTSGDVIAFLHSPHGSDHHLIALAKSGGLGLHHTSWCVASLDDVGLGMEQMSAAGHGEGWGVGRHVLGSNYFRYVRDPWGSYAEYSYDIDFVAPGAPWPATDHPPEDALYVWGPALPRTSSRTTNRTAERRMSYADRQRGWRDPAPARSACGAQRLARAPHLAHDAVHGDAVAQRHFARRQVFHAAGQQDGLAAAGQGLQGAHAGQQLRARLGHLRRTRRVVGQQAGVVAVLADFAPALAQAVHGQVAGHAEHVGARIAHLGRLAGGQAQPDIVQAVAGQVLAAQVGHQPATQVVIVAGDETLQRRRLARAGGPPGFPPGGPR